jgi:hypothetical protein
MRKRQNKLIPKKSFGHLGGQQLMDSNQSRYWQER